MTSEYLTPCRIDETACMTSSPCTVASPSSRSTMACSPPRMAWSRPPSCAASAASATLIVTAERSVWNPSHGRVSVEYRRMYICSVSPSAAARRAVAAAALARLSAASSRPAPPVVAPGVVPGPPDAAGAELSPCCGSCVARVCVSSRSAAASPLARRAASSRRCSSSAIGISSSASTAAAPTRPRRLSSERCSVCCAKWSTVSVVASRRASMAPRSARQPAAPMLAARRVTVDAAPASVASVHVAAYGARRRYESSAASTVSSSRVRRTPSASLAAAYSTSEYEMRRLSKVPDANVHRLPRRPSRASVSSALASPLHAPTASDARCRAPLSRAAASASSAAASASACTATAL